MLASPSAPSPGEGGGGGRRAAFQLAARGSPGGWGWCRCTQSPPHRAPRPRAGAAVCGRERARLPTAPRVGQEPAAALASPRDRKFRGGSSSSFPKRGGVPFPDASSSAPKRGLRLKSVARVCASLRSQARCSTQQQTPLEQSGTLPATTK